MQEALGFKGNHEFLLGAQDEDTDRGIGRGKVSVGFGGAIGGRVQADAHELEAIADRGAEGGGVFADAVGEDEGIEAAEGGGEGGDGAADAVDKEVEGELGAGISLGGGDFDGREVGGDARDAAQAGGVIEGVVQVGRGQAELALEVEEDAGVEGAATGAHHEAIEGAEAHGGGEGEAVADGGGGTTAAQVAGHEAEGRVGLAVEELGRAGGAIGVADAMEPEAADSPFLIPLEGDGIDQGAQGHPGEERGVENGDMRHAGEGGFGGLDSAQGGGIVQRGQGAEASDGGFDAGIDADACGEIEAAMDDAVADGGDGLRVGGGGLSGGVNDAGGGRKVIFDGDGGTAGGGLA